MNPTEVKQLNEEMKNLEKLSDDELSDMKTALENRISTLDKTPRPENFKGDVYFTTLAKEMGQKFFLADKISQILRSRGKPYKRAKEDVLEYIVKGREAFYKRVEGESVQVRLGMDVLSIPSHLD